MKLVEITFSQTPRIPGLRPTDMQSINCLKPVSPLENWKLSVRGAAVFLISPPGWRTGVHARDFDTKGPCSIFEIPRISCYLLWSGTPDEIANVTKFDTPPFGPEPVAKPDETPAPATKTGGLLDQVL